MDKKKYIEVLTEQANKHSRPQEMALSDFCDYLIEFFSIDAFKAGKPEYDQIPKDASLPLGAYR